MAKCHYLKMFYDILPEIPNTFMRDEACVSGGASFWTICNVPDRLHHANRKNPCTARSGHGFFTLLQAY
jgi:hypothetical protein